MSGRVFVVTGGGNGIGREVVLELLRRGGRVAAVDVDSAGLAQTSAAADTDRLSTHRVDLADRAAVEALAQDVMARHGQVDGLLNVAGVIQPFLKIVDLDYEAIERVLNVNFWGVVNTVKTFLPEMLTRPEAALVNVSSMGAFVAVPGQTAYGASKAAVKLLTEGLYAELRGTGVRVTAVYPGATATDITHNSGVEIPGSGDVTESPLKMTSASDAATQIVDGMEKGAYRVLIGKDTRGLDTLSRIAPKRATELVAKKLESLLS